ncbi:MAG: tRNA uridine-5-carboxymethylaminomethyl(34) synthesis enzyme MnmG [Bacilli bacterium]|nr:tRNA uridine-5-carboxymethylaminomethyl(34) synthesis enzyme MnmG [Bacilli bacterium]
MIELKYDIVVVGGGHAGCEASLACARMGKKTLLITGNFNNVADMPCNPSIGGSAKGIVVREIDALGGEMGYCADKTHLQIKMLNVKKGPGVRSLRAQGCKVNYPKEMLETLKNQENLDLMEDLAASVIVEDKKIKGVTCESGKEVMCDALILTTGTYLNSDILCGHDSYKGGPHGEKNSMYLSKSLEEHGIKIIRLKTGTPPRILKSSINFDEVQIEKGDDEKLSFSNFYEPSYDPSKQMPCYLTYTNAQTHKIIMDNLNKCALYSGLIKGVGPRYCPSIEDKIVKFNDKDRHQIFLEPERSDDIEYYVGGFSTTMPHEIQEKLLHTMDGLKECVITKYGYAIEYDAIDPVQLNMNLESKIIENLFTAGQINGTSGYEEAAAQGLIAGINAVLKLDGKEPFILKRNEAYIGVLIDDLINKGITEPYRLLTSRAEFRLLLRHDNASLRLTEYGRSFGLINDEKYEIYQGKLNAINNLMEYLKENSLELSEENNEFLKNNNSSPISGRVKYIELVKRPEIKLNLLLDHIGYSYSKEICDMVEIMIKYEGYINKTNNEVAKMLKLEEKQIPEDIDYEKVRNIATEAKQKFSKIRPRTIGQASRISGVNPSDITMLLVYLKKEYNND